MNERFRSEGASEVRAIAQSGGSMLARFEAHRERGCDRTEVLIGEMASIELLPTVPVLAQELLVASRIESGPVKG